MRIIGLGGIGAVKGLTVNDMLTFNNKIYTYGKTSKKDSTSAVKMQYAGFSMDNKHGFYIWSKISPKKTLAFFSKTSLNSNIESGTIKK